ncbi:MAG: ribosome maturation factor RimP [Candidatus Berkiellales bacterium]
MYKQEKWHHIIDPILVNTPFELVGVECTGGGKHTVVRIFIDKPGGITIDEIVDLTRQINLVLDVEEAVKGYYTLEVSSPGLERPLFAPEHFKQQIGQMISFKTNHPIENRHNFKGWLRVANDEGIEVEVDGKLCAFTYSDIDKAKVIPDIKIGG